MAAPQTSRRALLGMAAALATGPARAAFIPKLPAEPVSITFYDYNLAQAGIGSAATRRLLAEFEAANPTIHVEAIGAPPEQLNARVQMDVATGRTPDLAQMGFGDLDFNVHNLGVAALDAIIPPEELAGHFQGMVPAGLKLAEMEGHSWGIPFTFSTPVLFYNASLFTAAGLDPEAPPQTWAAVKAAALAIVARTGAHGFFAGMYSPPEVDWIYQGLVLSNGGRVLSEDRTRITFGEPPSVGVAEMLRDLVACGAHANLPPGGAADTMSSGQLGMYLQTSALQASMLRNTGTKFPLRATTMPAFGDKPTHPTNSGSGLFILSREPVRQRAAWELMKFLTSRHGYTVITSEIGYLPLRLDIVDDPAYLGPWVAAHPLVRPNLAQLTRLSPWESFPGPNYHQIQRNLMEAVKGAAFGAEPPAQIMQEAAARSQELMPRA